MRQKHKQRINNKIIIFFIFYKASYHFFYAVYQQYENFFKIIKGFINKKAPERTQQQSPQIQQQVQYPTQRFAFGPNVEERTEVQVSSKILDEPKKTLFKGMKIKKAEGLPEVQANYSPEPPKSFDETYNVQIERQDQDQNYQTTYDERQYNQPYETPTIQEDQVDDVLFSQNQIEPTQVSPSASKKKPGFGFLKKKQESDSQGQTPVIEFPTSDDQQDSVKTAKESIHNEGYEYSVQDNHVKVEIIPVQKPWGYDEQDNMRRPESEIILIQERQDEGKQIKVEIMQNYSPHQQNDTYQPVEEPQVKQNSMSFFTLKGKKQTQSPKSARLRQRFDAILEEIKQFDFAFNTRLTEIHIEEIQKEQTRQNNFIQIQSLNEKISQLNAELTTAVEYEQFDQADEIQQNLDRLNEQEIMMEKSIQQLNQQIEQLKKERLKIKSESGPFYHDTCQKLNDAEKAHKRFIDEFKLEQNTSLKRQMNLIEEEQERLKISQIHIEIDCKHLDQEEEHLIKLMNNQTKEQRVVQTELSAKRDNCQEAIFELQKQLALKQAELLLIDEDLEQVQTKIQMVEQKFSQQLQKVENKKYQFLLYEIQRLKFQEEIKILDNERAQLNQMENEYDKKQCELKNKLEMLGDIENSITQQKNSLENKKYQLSELMQQEMDVTEKQIIASEKTQNSYAILKKIEKSVNELNYRRNILEQGQNVMLNEKQNLSIKMPKLTSDKNHLIQNKSFKAAQAITNEIKLTQQKIQDLELSLNESYQREQDLIAQIEELDKQRVIDQDRYDNALQNSEIQRFYMLEFRLFGMDQLSCQSMSSPIKQKLAQNIEVTEREKSLIYQKYKQQIDQNTNVDVAEENHQQQDQELQMEESENDVPDSVTEQLTDSERQQRITLIVDKITILDREMSEVEEQMNVLAEVYQQQQKKNEQFDEAEELNTIFVSQGNEKQELLEQIGQLDFNSLEQAIEWLQNYK